jgi:protein SCO1/2
MSLPVKRLWLPFATLALGLAILAGVLAWGNGRSISAAMAIGGPFQLVNQDGKTVTDADFRGEPMLVYFGYTHCPDVCPTTLTEISQVFKNLGPKAPIRGLFITVDPERDTPAVMKEYLSSFDPRITGLTGGRPAIDATLKAYRVYSKKDPGKNGAYDMDHSSVVYLMDKNGRFANALDFDRISTTDTARQLQPYL